MVRMKFAATLLAVLYALALASSWSYAQAPTPRLVEARETKDYRRVVGGPAGAFYLVNKGSFEIVTVSADGLQLRELSSKSTPQTSVQGRYFALLDYSSYRPTTLEVSGIALHNSAGDLLWRRQGLGCNAFVLSDALPVAVGVRGAEGLAETQLLFLGADGKTLDSARVDHYTRGRFCGDGSHFFAVSGGTGVLRFSNAGELIAQYPYAGDYRVGFDGRWLAAITDTIIRIYDQETLVAVLPVELFSFRDLHFSSGGKFVAVLSKQHLQVLTLPGLNELWSYLPSDQTLSLVGLDTGGDFSRFLCSGTNSAAEPGERNTRGAIILLDVSGNVVWTEELSYAEWANGYPLVKLHPAASVFSVQTSEALRIYTY